MSEEVLEEGEVEGEVQEEVKPEYTEDEYIYLRLKHDKSPDFKALRHRFWQLGVQRRYAVLRHLGLAKPGEVLFEKVERFRLYKLREDGREQELVAAIEYHEAEILAENEKAEYVSQKEPTSDPGIKVHAGKVPTSKLVADHTVDVQTEDKGPSWDIE